MDIETQEIRLARQRASVKWLLSKAFNNRVPDNLKEPFYRDNENQERLKPQITVEMGNSTLYCQTLSNLYLDPNYQSLNHCSILQTLARKGVPVRESPDMPITETILIQTNPLRINAHISVIESLMILYAKEITSGDRIPNAIKRVSGGGSFQMASGQGCEQYLLAWISHVCASLKKRIAQEVERGATDENGVRLQVPDIPPIRDFQDLCDGVSLALLISYYCPKVVPWTSVRINYLPAVADSIHNVLLVSNFSQKHLPYSVFHMTPEDITYMRGSMRPNLIVLLADLFNLFEIHPAKCVCYPGMDAQVTRSASESFIQRRPTPPRDFRSVEENNYPLPSNNDEGFVVHKSRGIATLSSVQNQEPLVPARLRQAKEKINLETKADERGDFVPAGRPSNWEDQRRPSYAGRRSRRNSSSEDSQLTIENFGGSQDQLNLIGRGIERDRDRERERERERTLSNASIEPAVAVRSSIADARGTLQLGYDTDSGSEKQDRETEKTSIRRQGSVDNISPRNNKHSNKKELSDGDLSSHSGLNSSKTNIYNSNSVEETTPKRKTSFAELPSNTTTWHQQSALQQQSDDNEMYPEDESRSVVDASKLTTIRLKLEEKRRRIEQEKRKIEVALSKHQEKVGKAAFLQAIKQPYGSQQHIPDQFSRQPVQQAFGSTPQIPHAFNSTPNYNSQPTNSEPYVQHQPHPQQQQHQIQQLHQQQQQQHQLQHPQQLNPQQPQQQQQQQQQQHIQYINENGQYISQRPVSMSMQNQSPFMQKPQNSQQQAMMFNRGGGDGQLENGGYNKHGSQQLHHIQYPVEHTQYQSHQQQYISRPPEYDHYSPQPQNVRDHNSPQPPNPYYLYESSPQPTHRKTWGQPEQVHLQQTHYQPQPIQLIDINAWQSQTISPKVNSNEPATWNSPSNHQTNSSGSGFMLHQNEDNDYCHQEKSYQNLFQVHQNTQNRQTPPRAMMANHMESRQMKSSPVPVPYDEMAPQSICFIGDEDDNSDQIEMNIETMSMRKMADFNQSMRPQRGLNITSGSLTYRIPSPSRPSLNANSFQDPQEDATIEKGFYISFDNDQPKRPKPPLRAKRSPKVEKSTDTIDRGQKLPNIYDKSEIQRNSNFENNNATYNKYKDAPIQLRQIVESHDSKALDRRHLEDVTKKQQQMQNSSQQQQQHQLQKSFSSMQLNEPKENKALLIETEISNLNPESVDEMERKKEKIMLLSLQRRQLQEEAKARKEIEAMQRREKEQEKEEERMRKKEEQAARRAAILEQHRLKKAIEEAEREGKVIDRSDLPSQNQARIRMQKPSRPRPKTIHVETSSVDLTEGSSTLTSSRGKKGSITNLADYSQRSKLTRDLYRGSQDSLAMKNTGAGRATPPRRAPSPGMGSSGRHMPSPTGPGSLPPGLVSKRRGIEDSSSDISSSNPNSIMEYSGPKLYKQPAAKSNRGIILNAVEYCIFPGAVNRDSKQKVLEKIARSEAKHFLILFRDAGCQFRALYSFVPELEQVLKLYGTGPSHVDEVMFDKFFKYNSGGKCFSQIHTKHLTVTIDAFTIHNSLWQGKKVQLPSKKDMALVI
ncbi:patronin [Eupeodes corollae]|uniref:patronin n=1 Tax=Eupeodes corollae TaxID=290404 RepID=UPI00248FF72C|nr:patronin [Eupeodes corollae]